MDLMQQLRLNFVLVKFNMFTVLGNYLSHLKIKCIDIDVDYNLAKKCFSLWCLSTIAFINSSRFSDRLLLLSITLLMLQFTELRSKLCGGHICECIRILKGIIKFQANWITKKLGVNNCFMTESQWNNSKNA